MPSEGLLVGMAQIEAVAAGFTAVTSALTPPGGSWGPDMRIRQRASKLRRHTMLGDHPVFPILLSKDLAASRAFYHDLLGIEILREDEERIIFRCGGGTQLAVTLSTIGTADEQTQLAWIVPDLKAELAELRARGVTIEEYDAPDPKTEDGIADMGFAWSAWIIDPGGNALGIIEPKAHVSQP